MPSGCACPERGDVLGPESLVHRAVALPQQEAGGLDLGVARARPDRRRGFHTRHLLGPVAELVAGVAAQVLVGEEQHLVAPRPGAPCPLPGPSGAERPLEHGTGVGGGAHRPAVAPDERLERRRGVHVGDGHDAVDVGDRGQVVPGLLDGVQVGHVGHGAPGVEVGQDHLLVVARQDVGGLGHEVHAAEDDELGVVAVGGDPREPEGVSPGIGPAHHLVPLVVVPEDEQPVPEGRPWRRRSTGPARSGDA